MLLDGGLGDDELRRDRPDRGRLGERVSRQQWPAEGHQHVSLTLHDFRWQHADRSTGYCLEHLGKMIPDNRLDALIHCAADQGPVGPLVPVDRSPTVDEIHAWHTAIKTNLVSTYDVVRLCLPALRRSEDGRILLQHRDDKPGLVGAGEWGFFGGHIETGEPITRGFLREMREELAWSPRHLELYTTRDLAREGVRVTSHVYAAHLDVSLESLTLGEGQGMALFGPHALPLNTMSGIAPLVEEFVASPVYRRVRRR